MELKIELIITQKNAKIIAEAIAPLLADLLKNQIQEAVKVDNVLTVKQVAERLNRTEQTIRRWIRLKKLRTCNVGGLYGIRESEVEAFIDSLKRFYEK